MSATGQATIVIRGGMLIDGDGNAPVRNEALVIEGNRIRSVGVLPPDLDAGDPAIRVIEADGQWIMPWLVGDMFTLADINMLPFIHQFGNYRPALIDPANNPHTADWHRRCMERPAVVRTYNPSDEAPARPPQSAPAA